MYFVYKIKKYKNNNVILAGGIDKSNIRWILHYNMPQSIENYYQEIGRAGRDGQKSKCTMLFSPQDIQTQKLLIDLGIINIERKQSQYVKLQQIIDLVYSNDCYRKNILNYFGEDLENKCDNCSNCLNRGNVIDKSEDAMKVISCIIRMKRSYGINMIVDVLRGSKNKKVINLGFNTLSTYGIMKNYKSEDLKIFINTLISQGYLDMVESISNNNSFATIRINNMSREVIKGNKKVMLYEIINEDNNKQVNDLYEKLKNIRFIVAKENNIAPYMVFSDLTLMEMSEKYPRDKEQMLNISGVGEVKFEKYGQIFMEEIKTYIDENNIIVNDINENLNQSDDYLYVNSDKELYNRLKELRDFYAKKENAISYKILSKNTLKEISGRYPINKEQLLDISGIGVVKFDKYGEDIIRIIKEYLEEKSINPMWTEKKKLKVVIDGENRKNSEIALDLLNQGKNVDDVSLDIEVSKATLLTYVNEYILEGNILNFELNLSKYYSEDEKSEILNAMGKCENQNLNSIKRLLPPNIKYESIMSVIIEYNLNLLYKEKELC